MPVLTQVGQDILKDGGQRNSEVYRGILRLLAQFGYASIEEVMYGFDLALQEAINRLTYLERSGFITRFISHVKPESFFYLTPLGRQAALNYRITDHLTEFHPSKYRLSMQSHHRLIVKAHLALKKVLKEDFQGWVSKNQLRSEGISGWEQGAKRRIFDGEFHMRIHKKRYNRDPETHSLTFIDSAEEVWRCALEMEIILKSIRRYEKQFLDLYHLGEAYRFIRELNAAQLVKFIGKENSVITAAEMNRISVKVDL